MTTPLWEAQHPYHCHDGNYLADGSMNHGRYEYSSWKDFLEEALDWDRDYNVVFRWDWKVPDPDDYAEEVEWDPDFEMPGETLHLYMVQQRRGYFCVYVIKIEREDEPSVRAYLEQSAEYMRKIWEPLLP